MRFIHIADVHLGASPDAGSAYSKKRSGELWDALAEVVRTCRREETELLLVAGDLFHRQPLLRELKEVGGMFASLEKTKVVLIAGNHDYIRQDSYYRTFHWSSNVTMLKEEKLECAEFPELNLAVYGLSYHSREIREARYEQERPRRRQKYEILLAHGGDENHIPIHKAALLAQGYDYVALGHIHKPQVLEENRMIYAGALEPVDTADCGPHGYVKGELDEKGCRTEFVSSAGREYRQIRIAVDKAMTGFQLREQICRKIEAGGTQNIYKVRITGYRDPEIRFDLSGMDVYGNIVEMSDETKPAYAFEKLLMQNEENLLGSYIKSFLGAEENSVEYQALCLGVRALIDTRAE